MKIDKAQVEYVANLARIALSEEEKELFAEQLGKIIEYVEKLNELDTSNVDPMAHATGLKNVFRDDVPGTSLTPEKALADAPDKEDHFFRVPKVV
jgi:aspartyl-tRNA(Asn)/glutamyl-tRNA(Gln) amidotransferase subunit C